MKALKLFAVLAVAAILGCDQSPSHPVECQNVFDCHQEAIQETAERMEKTQEMVLLADPVAIGTMLEHPLTRALYAPMEHVPLDHRWSLFVITPPEHGHSPPTWADHHREPHDPVCDTLHARGDRPGLEAARKRPDATVQATWNRNLSPERPPTRTTGSQAREETGRAALPQPYTAGSTS